MLLGIQSRYYCYIIFIVVTRKRRNKRARENNFQFPSSGHWPLFHFHGHGYFKRLNKRLDAETVVVGEKAEQRCSAICGLTDSHETKNETLPQPKSRKFWSICYKAALMDFCTVFPQICRHHLHTYIYINIYIYICTNTNHCDIIAHFWQFAILILCELMRKVVAVTVLHFGRAQLWIC